MEAITNPSQETTVLGELGETPAGAPEPTVHRCDLCERTFGTRQGLSSHMTRTHNKRSSRRKRTVKPAQSAPLTDEQIEQRLFRALPLENGIGSIKSMRRIAAWIEEGLAISRAGGK